MIYYGKLYKIGKNGICLQKFTEDMNYLYVNNDKIDKNEIYKFLRSQLNTDCFHGKFYNNDLYTIIIQEFEHLKRIEIPVLYINNYMIKFGDFNWYCNTDLKKNSKLTEIIITVKNRLFHKRKQQYHSFHDIHTNKVEMKKLKKLQKRISNPIYKIMK